MHNNDLANVNLALTNLSANATSGVVYLDTETNPYTCQYDGYLTIIARDGKTTSCKISDSLGVGISTATVYGSGSSIWNTQCIYIKKGMILSGFAISQSTFGHISFAPLDN